MSEVEGGKIASRRNVERAGGFQILRFQMPGMSEVDAVVSRSILGEKRKGPGVSKIRFQRPGVSEVEGVKVGSGRKMEGAGGFQGL